MVKDDTILWLGAIGVGAYFLSKTDLFSKAGSGVGDIFEGVGDAFQGVGGGLGAAGQAAGRLVSDVSETAGSLLDIPQQLGGGVSGALNREFNQADVIDRGVFDVTKGLVIQEKAIRTSKTEKFKTNLVETLTNPFGQLKKIDKAYGVTKTLRGTSNVLNMVPKQPAILTLPGTIYNAISSVIKPKTSVPQQKTIISSKTSIISSSADRSKILPSVAAQLARNRAAGIGSKAPPKNKKLRR